MNSAICLILSSPLLFLQQSANHKESARLDELRGEWRVLAWDYEGYWLSADEGAVGEYYRNLRVIFTEERVIIKPGGSGRSLLWGIPFTWECSYKIDSGKRPRELDITGLSWSAKDPKPTYTNEVWRAIYAVNGDKVVVCVDVSDNSKRPTDFTIAPRRSHTIVLLERKKAPTDDKAPKPKQ
jgi:uncharacterized protein (TIGR03067 family)